MDQDHLGNGSRRVAFKQGLGVVIAVVASTAFAAPGKLSKEAVKYTDAGNVAGKDCDDCSQYVPGKTAKDPASCRIVEGPISPHGHCIAFSPKAK